MKNFKYIARTMVFAAFAALIFAVANNQKLYAQNLTADAPDQPFGEYLAGRHALANNQFDVAADNYLKALNLDPDNISLNQYTLSILIIDGRFDDAIRISEKLAELDQENDLSKLMLFFDKAKSGNYEDALVNADELASTGILNLINPFFRAWILAGQGEQEEVEQIIAGFEEGTSFNFFNYFQSGLIYEYFGENDKAEQYYSMALTERGMTNLRAAEAYGRILSRQGKTPQALDVFNEYVEEAPSNEQLKAALAAAQNGEEFPPFVTTVNDGFAELFYTVATILMQDNVKRVATNYLQYAVFFKPDFPLAHFLQAQIFESDRYFEGATKQLDRIKSDSPLYFQSNLQRAWLLDEMELSDQALEAFKQLEKEYPGNRNVLNSIAEFYRTHERYAEAIPAYDKVIATIVEENERDWVLYYTRGIVLDQEKKWSEAERDFKKALELRPEQPMVLNYLAYSWVDQGKNYEEAKAMLERAVELRPNDGYIIDSLGWALFKMGDEQEAVPILERAAQLQTQDWAINDHLGDVYWVVGRRNEARFQWRHALSLTPDVDKVYGIKDKIKNGYNR